MSGAALSQALSQTSNRWFVRHRPRPQAALRLYCLPHAGGGPLLFRQWSDSLPSSVEVCAVQLPGREARFSEPAFTRWQPLVDALADAVAAANDRPFALFGHSMGALLAFELARRLRRLGQPEPAYLLVSGYAAPHLGLDRPPAHALPEAEFRAELRARNGTPTVVLENDEMMRLFSPLLRADFAVCETYTYQSEPPLGCPCAAFGGLRDPLVTPERLLAWKELTDASFESLLLPGDHFFPATCQALLLEQVGRLLERHFGTEASDWRTPATVPALAADEVQVWRLPLDRTDEEVGRLRQLLDQGERERADRFRFPRDRSRFITGRGLMRLLLAPHVGQAPEQLQFRYAAAGKPFLREHGLQFNLAHSDNLALLAVAGRRAVGVDLERIRESLEILTIADRYFAPDERTALGAESVERKRQAFFQCWTRKEAYMKATGLGLQMPLDEFAVLQTPGSTALRLQRMGQPDEAARWSLRDLQPGPGYTGTVAIAGHGWRLTCWDEPRRSGFPA